MRIEFEDSDLCGEPKNLKPDNLKRYTTRSPTPEEAAEDGDDSDHDDDNDNDDEGKELDLIKQKYPIGTIVRATNIIDESASDSEGEAETLEDRFPVGCRVVTHSLSAAQYNEELAVVLEHVGGDPPRIRIQFEDDDVSEEPKNLKADNLKRYGVVEETKPPKPPGHSQFNGMLADIIGYHIEENEIRIQCQFDEDQYPTAIPLHEDNLIIIQTPTPPESDCAESSHEAPEPNREETVQTTQLEDEFLRDVSCKRIQRAFRMHQSHIREIENERKIKLSHDMSRIRKNYAAKKIQKLWREKTVSRDPTPSVASEVGIYRQFPIDSRVELHNLAAAPAFNGMRGIVKGHSPLDADIPRVSILLDGFDAPKMIKPANLQLVEGVEEDVQSSQGSEPASESEAEPEEETLEQKFPLVRVLFIFDVWYLFLIFIC